MGANVGKDRNPKSNKMYCEYRKMLLSGGKLRGNAKVSRLRRRPCGWVVRPDSWVYTSVLPFVGGPKMLMVIATNNQHAAM